MSPQHEFDIDADLALLSDRYRQFIEDIGRDERDRHLLDLQPEQRLEVFRMSAAERASRGSVRQGRRRTSEYAPSRPFQINGHYVGPHTNPFNGMDIADQG